MRFFRFIANKLRSIFTGRQRAAFLVVALAIGLGLLIPHLVHAQILPSEGKFTTWLVNAIFYPIVQFLGNCLVVIINILIAVAQYNDFINATAVAKGWVIVRDLCNMFFIIILLVIAFGTILKLEQYRYNRLLGKLIIYAFLINFSKFIAGFWIDIGQVIMLTFVNGFKDAAAGNLASGLGMSEMLTLAKDPSAGNVDSSGIFGAMLLAIALLIIAVIVVIIMTVILLLRILTLWILLVLSPIAFITRIFPNTAKYSDQWWGEFNKQIMVGPVMAFFLWLALTIIAVNGAESRSYGFKEVSTAEGSALIQNMEGTGGGTAKNIAASITTISESDNLLSYMITIGLLLGALQAAQQIGVAGSKIAGDWSQKIRTGGLTAAGVLSGVAGARLALRGAKAGGKKVAGTVGRLLSEKEFTVRGRGGKERKIQPGRFVTKKYWEGVWERGRNLQSATDARLKSKGMHDREVVQYGREAAADYHENEIEGQITSAESEFSKKVGPNPGTEKLVREYLISLRQAETGGLDERIKAAGAVNTIVKSGNLDDVMNSLIEMGELREDNMEKFGFSNFDDVIHGHDDERARAIMSSSLQLERGKYDAYAIGMKKAGQDGSGTSEDDYRTYMNDATLTDEERNDLLTKNDRALQKVIIAARAERNKAVAGASEVDRIGLKAMYRAGESARLNGHDEQTVANYDAKNGRAYVMDPEEQLEHVMKQRSKMNTNEKSKTQTPHGFAGIQWEWDEDEQDVKRDEHGNTIAHRDISFAAASPLSVAKLKEVIEMQGRDKGNIGRRVFDAMLGIEGGVGISPDQVMFDKSGMLKNREMWKKRLEVFGKDVMRKYYAGIFGNFDRPDDSAIPTAEGFEDDYLKQVAERTHAPRAGSRTTGSAGSAPPAGKWTRTGRKRPKVGFTAAGSDADEEIEEREVVDSSGQTRTEERVVRRVEVEKDELEPVDQADRAVSEAEKRASTVKVANIDELKTTLDTVRDSLESLTDTMKTIQPKLKYADERKDMEKLIKTAKGQSDTIHPSRLSEFASTDPEYKRKYFEETAQIIKDMKNAILATTKVRSKDSSKPGGTAGDTGGPA